MLRRGTKPRHEILTKEYNGEYEKRGGEERNLEDFNNLDLFYKHRNTTFKQY